jgi:hypothetical protein
MYYDLERQTSGKANALSLRDRRESGQYYQYEAIPRYATFYVVYVKSAKRRVCG